MSMDAEGTESPTTNEVEGEVEHAECMEPILEEGTYVKSKLIHTSTKLFWRYKATYEFHFFELLETDLIQLICLDHESNEEPHHMFLSFSGLSIIYIYIVSMVLYMCIHSLEACGRGRCEEAAGC